MTCRGGAARRLQWRDRVGFAPTSRGRRGKRQIVTASRTGAPSVHAGDSSRTFDEYTGTEAAAFVQVGASVDRRRVTPIATALETRSEPRPRSARPASTRAAMRIRSRVKPADHGGWQHAADEFKRGRNPSRPSRTHRCYCASGVVRHRRAPCDRAARSQRAQSQTSLWFTKGGRGRGAARTVASGVKFCVT